MRWSSLSLLVAFCLSVGLTSAAQAQNTATNSAQQNSVLAPYDPQLIRLSEILGAVHYLRSLCGASEGQKWRDQMQALIEAENPDVNRRGQMAGAFNRGYRGFQRTHKDCTDASRLLADRYMREGSQIASLVATRYGN